MINSVEDVSGRLAVVQKAVSLATQRAGRSDSVTLVAVSKTIELARVRAAYDAGQRIFGENRVREATEKRAELDRELPDAEWSLIGHLQSNKAGAAVDAFDSIQSVDSLRLATKLQREAAARDTRLPILLEVNVAGEQSKQGFALDELRHEFAQLLTLPQLELRGLMTIAPAATDPADIAWVFRELRELRDELRDRFALPAFAELSMGMSNDFEDAIRQGATMVRIGRSIFGERPPPAHGITT